MASARDPTSEELGRHVGILRQELGLSIEEFAERSRLSLADVRVLEAGERSIDLDTLWAIADGLGMSVGTIVRLWHARRLK